MRELDPNGPFSWLTVNPDNWYTVVAILSQRCTSCNDEMQGTSITNARGGWEHFKCASDDYRRVHNTRADDAGAIVRLQVQQHAMIELLKAHALQRVTVIYDPDENNRLGRWTVEVVVEVNSDCQ